MNESSSKPEELLPLNQLSGCHTSPQLLLAMLFIKNCDPLRNNLLNK